MRKPYYISCLRKLNHQMDSLQHDFACGGLDKSHHIYIKSLSFCISVYLCVCLDFENQYDKNKGRVGPLNSINKNICDFKNIKFLKIFIWLQLNGKCEKMNSVDQIISLHYAVYYCIPINKQIECSTCQLSRPWELNRA